MDSESPDSANLPLDEKINNLSQLAEHITNSLSEGNSAELEEILEELSTLSSSLSHISHLVAEQIEDQENHLALANISQVVNSSLHLDQVLRIVMDTIVRLTGAVNSAVPSSSSFNISSTRIEPAEETLHSTTIFALSSSIDSRNIGSLGKCTQSNSCRSRSD